MSARQTTIAAGDVRVGDVLVTLSGRSGERNRKIERNRVRAVGKDGSYVKLDVGAWLTWKHEREGVAVEREASL